MNRIINANKLLIMFFMGLMLVGTVSAVNWYVDNAVGTSGNGQSWSTSWKNFANINWNSIQPGDTLYISGGSTSKTYVESMTVRDSGITITKGIDLGHNGRVIIRAPTKRSGNGILIDANANGIGVLHNITVKNLEFYDWAIGVNVNSRDADEINSIRIENNKFYCYIAAIDTQGGSNDPSGNQCKNIWIINNYIELPEDGSDDNQIDGMSIYYTRNVYIIGNTFVNRDTRTLDSHNDLVQGAYNTNQYYFNNFFMIDNMIQAGQNGVQLGGNSAGDFYFVNNVVNMGTWTQQSAVWAELFSVQNPDKMRILNNIFIGGHPRHLLLGADSNAVIKNNLLWATGTHTFGDYSRNSFIYVETADGSTESLNVEHNNFYWYMSDQVYMQGTNTPTMPTSNTWMRYPNYAPSMINFDPIPQDYNVNPYSENPQDYRLTSASIREIDRGETLQQSDFTVDSDVKINPWYYISRDFNGNLRTGAWDIGAYEFVDGAITYHPADTNQDGCVSLGEISSYVSLWLSGNGVTLSQVSDGVSEWMNGC